MIGPALVVSSTRSVPLVGAGGGAASVAAAAASLSGAGAAAGPPHAAVTSDSATRKIERIIRPSLAPCGAARQGRAG